MENSGLKGETTSSGPIDRLSIIYGKCGRTALPSPRSTISLLRVYTSLLCGCLIAGQSSVNLVAASRTASAAGGTVPSPVAYAHGPPAYAGKNLTICFHAPYVPAISRPMKLRISIASQNRPGLMRPSVRV